MPCSGRTRGILRTSSSLRPSFYRWHVYMVRCRDGTLYTGIATDVSRRFLEHQQGEGKGAKYLRGRAPLRLVLQRAIGARGLALSVERRIKKLPKARKEALIGKGAAIEHMVQQIKNRL